MDPAFQLFGRTPWSGSGRVADYFGSPMDLSYLTTGRPDFIPDDGNYNPDLDVPSLLNQGVPYEQAMMVQGLRARLHEQAARERARVDAQGALTELSQIDPSRETFAKDLLGIFRKYPNARRSKDFVDQVEMIGQFSRMMPQKPEVKMFDLSEIKDPEIRSIAIQEKWDTLPENQGQIRAYDAQYRKAQKLDLVKAGYSPEQIAEMEKTGGLTDVGVLHAMNQIKQKPERTLTPEAAGDLSKLFRGARESRRQRESDAWKLQWIQDNLLPAGTSEEDRRKEKDFPASAWSKAWYAAQEPTDEELEFEAYMNLMGQTPGGLSRAALPPTTSPSTEKGAAAPTQGGGTMDSPVIIETEEAYKALPSGTYFRDSSGKLKQKK